MITRIYIDNFRSLVNFEWKPGRLALLLGDNGSGKSSVIDVLRGVRSIIIEQEPIKGHFPRTSRTRWDKRLEFSLELDVQLGGSSYHYALTIEHSEIDSKSRVAHEVLRCSERPVVELAGGELQLYTDDGVRGAVVAGDPFRSGVGAVTAGKRSTHLTTFKKWLSDLWALKPNPPSMSSRTDGDGDFLQSDFSNFASWLQREMTENIEGVIGATNALRQVIDGFQSLQVSRLAYRLEATFLADSGSPYAVAFDSLSDGQRQLCALYFFRHMAMAPGRLLIFDEPDNYVALREIQPWLAELIDLALAETGPQIWIISHHPEVINQLAPGHGTRFFRGRGHTRIAPFAGTEGLTAAETVARGWDGE